MEVVPVLSMASNSSINSTDDKELFDGGSSNGSGASASVSASADGVWSLFFWTFNDDVGVTSPDTAFLQCDSKYSISFRSFDDDGNDEGANPFDSNNTNGANSFNGDGADPLKGSNKNGADSFNNTDDTTAGSIFIDSNDTCGDCGRINLTGTLLLSIWPSLAIRRSILPFLDSKSIDTDDLADVSHNRFRIIPIIR